MTVDIFIFLNYLIKSRAKDSRKHIIKINVIDELDLVSNREF